MIENILNVNGIDYKISSPEKLTEEQIEMLKMEIMSGKAKITTLNPATCPPSAKYVGQSVTLSATPTGGTPGTLGYTVEFRRNGVAIPGGTFTGVPEATLKTIPYTFVSGDTPSVNLSVYVSDSCPTGAKSNTDQCIVTVSVCAIPSCNFTVA